MEIWVPKKIDVDMEQSKTCLARNIFPYDSVLFIVKMFKKATVAILHLFLAFLKTFWL